MTIPSQIHFVHVPTTTNNDCAVLNLTDLNGNAPTPGDYLLDGPLNVTANDGGTFVGLTVSESQIIACAIAVGVATVTIAGTEAGAAVTGTLIATVTTSGGQLHTAWTSGTITML